MVAPVGGEGGAGAAEGGFVHDIVMDEGRQMDHFDDDCGGDGGLAGFLEDGGAEAEECGAELFALAGEGVVGVGGDFGVEGVDLGDELFSDEVKEMPYGLHHVSPDRIGVGGWWGEFDWGWVGFCPCTQHARPIYGWVLLKSNRLNHFPVDIGVWTGDDDGVDEDSCVGDDAASGGDGGLDGADVAGHGAEGFSAEGHGEADFDEGDLGGFGGGIGG
ncbi:MAG: hypothetical protein RI897_1761 [Verrucomicrobiota bacterium]